MQPGTKQRRRRYARCSTHKNKIPRKSQSSKDLVKCKDNTIKNQVYRTKKEEGEEEEEGKSKGKPARRHLYPDKPVEP
jgi:hypothetical protein